MLDLIIYPAGKTKETVVTGDLVKIGTQEFYVMKHSGEDLLLLSRYNLKVGGVYSSRNVYERDYTPSDPGYGLQSSEVLGFTSLNEGYNGSTKFGTDDYWLGKIGTVYNGHYCTNIPDSDCIYIYDSNSYLYQPLENYKSYHESLGATIKSVRVPSLEEVLELGCGTGGAWNCTNAPSFVIGTSYYLGTLYSEDGYMYLIGANNMISIGGFNNPTGGAGLRALIII